MSELSTIQDLLQTLPADRRAEVFQIAHALGIRPGADEFLYAILVGLGYHKSLLCAVPDRLADVGEQTAHNLAQLLHEGAASIIQAGGDASAEVHASIAKAAAEIQLAAGRGAARAVEQVDLTPILSAMQQQATRLGARDWFGRGLIAAAAALVLTLAGGALCGWYVHSSFNPQPVGATLAQEYFSQLTCGPVRNGYFQCADRQGGSVRLSALLAKQ